jgi:hypothetical protein
VLVAVKEHDRDWIVEFVHSVEIWHFYNVNQVNNAPVLYLFSHLVEHFIHLHAVWVPVSTEAYYN